MRRFLVVSFVASILAGGLLPVAAETRIPRGRLGVGDSIMLSASDELLTYEIPVAAKVGRQFFEGARIVRRRARDGTLPKQVIVHLGTNGPIDPAQCASVVAAPGSHRRGYFCTPPAPRQGVGPDKEN